MSPVGMEKSLYQRAIKTRCCAFWSIFHPTIAPPPQPGPATVLLYLPQGPLSEERHDDLANLTSLRSGLPYPVVQVNYRLSKTQPYPTPIHDVLAGYDWVKKHLLPKRSVSRAGRPDHVGRIAVAGELIGGGLAAMLALTECRKGEPGIVAAMVHRPLVDWLLPETEESPQSKEPDAVSQGDLIISTVLKARDQLFTRPDGYFDPFASPILFFRTAGVEPPKPKTSMLDDLAELSLLDREDFHREQALLSGVTQASLQETMSQGSTSTPPKKKASRLFPNKAFNLDLPSFHVSSGKTSALFGQAEELSQVLRKSMIRQRKARLAASKFGRKTLMEDEQDQMDEDQQLEKLAEEAEADEKVRFSATQGSGTWGKSGMEDAILWLKGKLR